MFRVYVRNWWREATPEDGRWPNDLVPNSGDKGRRIGSASTEEEAQRLCREYNSTHQPGRLSKKAEYERE